MYNIRNYAIRLQIMASYQMEIVMFALSFTVYGLVAKQIKMPKVWHWKWRSRPMKRKKGPSPFDWQRLVPYWGIFHNFSCPATYVYPNLDTHFQKYTDTHTHTITYIVNIYIVTEAFWGPAWTHLISGPAKTTVAGSTTVARPSLNRGNRYEDRCYLHLMLTN